jgi:hypothetical protein
LFSVVAQAASLPLVALLRNANRHGECLLIGVDRKWSA